MSESRSYHQVGAHEKCPCGSGKNYIDCCLDSNVRWVKDDKGEYVRMQNFKGSPPPTDEDAEVEEMPLLKLDIVKGKYTYTKNSRMSRLSSFPPDMLKMAISVIEVEKTQVIMEAFGKFLERTHEGMSEEEADADRIEDGSYVLLLVTLDADSGRPLGIGGRRVSSMMSEASLLMLIGALEEIKTDMSLCLNVNAVINGMMGSVDYDEGDDDE
jgi:hypothetical protein